MKKVSLLIVVMFSLIFNTANAKATLTEKEQKFINIITKDFINSHSLNLKGFDFYDTRAFASNDGNLTNGGKSLTNILRDIAKEQNLMDCSPLFYIDKSNNKGYVLEKRLSGMNNLLILSYDKTSQVWKVTSKVEKMGKDLVELGLVKGAN
ncbi:hypothetical protein HPT25_03855 [Bacillus sp. BRMEA1]|uniref:hypothetical protein n=1 Tax=Neobacillus endophyticus TaxID=2738405 RepID=UPI001564B2EC|nr:hypothetical protein [Neobacillus endophyticus]NRD76625.1 hypothetical protein [Neobacillus endophyticus]